MRDPLRTGSRAFREPEAEATGVSSSRRAGRSSWQASIVLAADVIVSMVAVGGVTSPGEVSLRVLTDALTFRAESFQAS
jgi:hypothetical protein